MANAERTAGTPRTIEEIEQRAAEIHDAEKAAFERIAEVLRDLAVTLPTESRLPVRFAETASSLDLFSMPIFGIRSVDALAAEYGRETIEDFTAICEQVLRRTS